jgi:hypothetical protein
VLIDLAGSQRAGESRPDPFRRKAFSPADLRALDAQGTDLRFGDILCVRTGWMNSYLALGDAGGRSWP